jgi:hypothetical protein
MTSKIVVVKRLLPLIVIAALALALAGCGGGSGTSGASAPTGRTPAPTPAHPNINALGVSEPEDPASSCPHRRAQLQREIAKLKRLVRHRRLPQGTDEITVSCPSHWNPGDRVQGSRPGRSAPGGGGD